MALATGHAGAGITALGATLGTAALARAGASLVTYPRFINWLAATQYLSPRQMGTHLKRLNLMATNEKDEALKAELTDFAAQLEAELQGQD